MRAIARSRLVGCGGEEGMTMIEVLVATAMALVVVGGATSMLITAVRQEPNLSKQAQGISTARWQLERITRELRDGIAVTSGHAKSTEVSFVGQVRRTSCGGTVLTSETAPAIKCQITYACTTTSCSRVEAAEGVFASPPGSQTTAITGINSSAVFCFVPSTEKDPTACGTAASTSPRYVGVTLRVPNPSGSDSLTISDGASLRATTLAG
jgi:Tfp pilus assembly protein PilV